MLLRRRGRDFCFCFHFFAIYIIHFALSQHELVMAADDDSDNNSNNNRISLPHNDKSERLLTQKVCRIAEVVGARINFIYSSIFCENGNLTTSSPTSSSPTSSSSSSTYYMEMQLHKCMADTLPLHALCMEHFHAEPIRQSSSLSIFILPDATATAAATTTPEMSMMRMKAIGAWLNAKQRLKHMHKYIFIWRGATLQQLTEFFHLIWLKHILQAIIVSDTKRIYTFEPFTVNGFSVKLCTEQLYFYDKLKNFHHFVLKISMFNDPVRAQVKTPPAIGYSRIDGHVAETIVGLLNATPKYIEPADKQNYGACRKDGTFTGAINDIVLARTHVGFNSRFNLECMKLKMEELYPYRRRFLYLVVPAAKMRPEYRIFVDAFTHTLWLLLSVNFVLVVICFYVLQRCLQRLPHLTNMRMWRWYEIFDMLFKTQLGEPVDGFERISSLREFLIAWIFFSYVLTTVYFGKLESSFVRPAMEPEIDSLTELHRVNMPIYAVSNILDAVNYTLEAKYWNQIKVRARRLPLNYSAYPYATNIAKKSHNVAFILRDETLKEFIASTYDSVAGRPTFHAVKQYLRSMHRTYIVPLGSPFLDKFQQLVSAFYEYGLLEYWINLDMRHRLLQNQNEFENIQDDSNYDDLDADEPTGAATSSSSSSSDPNNVHKKSHKKVVLTIEILQGAFYVWLFGILFSLIGLGCEYLYWLRETKNVMLI